jgi:hypothetical protein
MVSCSSTQLVENWKNPDIDTYEPSKVLIVGMTSNTSARQKFEQQLKDEFEQRGVEGVMSLELFEPTFTTEEQSESDLKRIENILIANGFDTVLFTKIIGVEDKIVYKKNYGGFDETYRRFNEDYLMNQDIFYNPDYYEEYTVYNAETSMYCICAGKDRELIWKGYIEIIDPQSIDTTINDYVRLVIVVLEEQQLINLKINIEEEPNVWPSKTYF